MKKVKITVLENTLAIRFASRELLFAAVMTVCVRLS